MRVGVASDHRGFALKEQLRVECVLRSKIGHRPASAQSGTYLALLLTPLIDIAKCTG